MDEENRKTCFIITPIGDELTPIRRHIEGIIDAAIIPAIKNEFVINVAHRLYETGSITKQIISEIYKSDLVIANITDRNPNVMYELAFRHCLGKPVITIASDKTILPADIICERTIFYKNDAKGTLELTEELKKYIKILDLDKIESPIHTMLSDIINTDSIIKLSKEQNKQDGNAIELILNKLERINEKAEIINKPAIYKKYYYFLYDEKSSNFSMQEVMDRFNNLFSSKTNISLANIDDVLDVSQFAVKIEYIGEIDSIELLQEMREILESSGACIYNTDIAN